MSTITVQIDGVTVLQGTGDFGPTASTPGGTGPSGQVTANQTPGKEMTWSEQAGHDSDVVGQGWQQYPFTPPKDGSYKLDVSGRAPAVIDFDISVTGPDFKQDFNPKFGAFNGWVGPFKGGQQYMVSIGPKTPPDGGYAARFEAGNFKPA